MFQRIKRHIRRAEAKLDRLFGGGEPTIPSTQTPITSSPGPARAGHTAWAGIETLLDVLSVSAGEFGPLKTAIGELLRCMVTHENRVATREEYPQLKVDLEKVCQEIAGYIGGAAPPSMGPSVSKLAREIEEEINLIDQKMRRNVVGRYAEAMNDVDEILTRYQRTQRHLDAFALSAGMKIWQVVDDQATRTLLRELPNSPAAKYCSTESGSVGRNECTPNTRVDVIQQLFDWARDPEGRKIYWLNGMAGTGKTTIAYSLCSHLEREGRLGASFFCSRQLPTCRRVGMILPSIAYQLSLSSRPFRYEISATLERDPDVYNQPIDRQFLGLIVTPLRKVRCQLRRDIIVVIDALDECEDANSVGHILSALLTEVTDLPIKVFLTSRPEPTILSRMENERGEQVRSELRLHELERSIVQSDIKTYLATELAELDLEPSMLAKLVEQSGVLFVYASTVVRYVRHNDLVRSIQRLRLITTGPTLSNHSSQQIDELYNSILEGALNDSHLELSERDEMTKILRIVISAQEPLTVNAISSLLGIDQVESVWAALRPLLSVLQASKVTGLVTTLHESFPDYLLDSKRSGDFFCDPRRQHSWFTHTCFDTIERLNPLFNICHLGSSYLLDAEVPGLEKRVSSAISDDLSYACQYWESHLVLTQSPENFIDRLFLLLSTRLFLWMETMNLKHNINACVIILSRLNVWLPRVQTSVEVKELVHDAWRFVHAFASGPIRQMTPHIYVSVLALWPKHRPLSRYRSNHFVGFAGAAGTALDRRDVTPLATLNAPDQALSVACSSDGARIIAGCLDNTICIWNAHTGQTIGEPLAGHTDGVSCIAFSPDSRRIVSGSRDRTVRIWDIYTGKTVGEPLEGHNSDVRSVNYSPNGAHIVSGSNDRTIRIWDARTGQLLGQPLTGHTGSVYSVAYSPNGATIVSGSTDMTIRVWDAQTRSLRGQPLKGHADGINTVSYSPDGTRIVSGSNDKTARIWDAGTGQMSTKPLTGHTARIWSVKYSPDGARIISGSEDSTICIWDACTGHMLGQPLRGHSSWVHSVTFSPDGLRIISGSHDKTVRIWDAQFGQTLKHPPDGHAGLVHSVACSPDGARIASGSTDSTVCIWDVYTGKLVGQPLNGHTDWVYSVAYSFEGTRIVSGSADSTIRIWDAINGEMVGTPLEGHTDCVWSVVFSPDGSRIVSGSEDNTLRIWDIHTGQMVGQPLKGHTGTVFSVAFSPDGTRIVSGSGDMTICIWDACTGQMVGQPLEGHTSWVRSTAYSPSGNHIVSGSRDTTIRIWDASTGEMVGRPLEGHRHWVMSIAYSPDGAHIVSGSSDETIRIWDARTGHMIGQPLEGHTNVVSSVTYSADSGYLVSGSRDKSIRIWDIRVLSNSCKVFPDDSNFTRKSNLSSDLLGPISSTSNNLSHVHESRTRRGFPIRPNRSDPNAWTLSNDGWVISHDLKPLLWVPPELRGTLLRYGMERMISMEGSWSLDLSKAELGMDWQQCYRS